MYIIINTIRLNIVCDSFVSCSMISFNDDSKDNNIISIVKLNDCIANEK